MEQNNFKKQLIDQSAHFLVATLLLIPFLLFPNIFTVAIIGFGMGMIREVSQRGNYFKFSYIKDILISKWSMLDILFWTLGSMFIFVII